MDSICCLKFIFIIIIITGWLKYYYDLRIFPKQWSEEYIPKDAETILASFLEIFYWLKSTKMKEKANE